MDSHGRACLSVSCLPAFAQPYRPVNTPTIAAVFNGLATPQVGRWSELIRGYWRRFETHLPVILRPVLAARKGQNLEPPHTTKPEGVPSVGRDGVGRLTRTPQPPGDIVKRAAAKHSAFRRTGAKPPCRMVPWRNLLSCAMVKNRERTSAISSGVAWGAISAFTATTWLVRSAPRAAAASRG